MEKKAEPEITVLELVGERRFVCQHPNLVITESHDLEGLNFLIGQMETSYKIIEACDKGSEMIKNLKSHGKKFLKIHSDLAANLIKINEDFLKYLDQNFQGNVENKLPIAFLKSDEIENIRQKLDFGYSSLAKEVSLLKKAAGF